jgi:DNA polymerase-3 subunit epsilon
MKMAKKYIILDTETTGLEVQQGHRVIEIGAVLINDRNKSEEHFHTFINPTRLIDEEASKVHGIMNEDLTDKPLFEDIAEEFLEFIDGSTLVIHNAPFDVGFLNHELKLASSKYPTLEEICKIEDSLAIARDKYPGQRNSLDALASRFNISGYDRTFHGALLDANILADVYMALTGGQSKFEFSNDNFKLSEKKSFSENLISKDELQLAKVKANKTDLQEHEDRLADIETLNSVETIWRKVH